MLKHERFTPLDDGYTEVPQPDGYRPGLVCLMDGTHAFVPETDAEVFTLCIPTDPRRRRWFLSETPFTAAPDLIPAEDEAEAAEAFAESVVDEPIEE